MDVLGLLFALRVSAASVPERDEADRLFEALEDDTPRLGKTSAGCGYTPPIGDYLLAAFGWDLEVITPTKAEPGFHVRPWCWIVERTFGSLTKHRRLAKDYERTTASSEALITVATIGNKTRRLVQPA